MLESRFGVAHIRCLHTALSPIFHGGDEKTGSVVLLNRIRFIVNGRPVDVPFISGNGVRGYLRRLVFRDFLARVGFRIPLDKKEGLRLWHTLFSGGVLEAREGEHGVIDLSLRRRVYVLIPPARLWGFSFKNQSLEGKLKVSPMLPVARETAPFLPDDVASNAQASVYELITKVFQTRRDEIRAPREKDEQAVQMLVEYEAFAPGTVFFQEFAIEDPAPIDEAVLAHTIDLWKARPFIGGKTAIGMGRLRIDCDTSVLASPQVYLKYIEDNKDRIREALRELMEALK